VPILWLFTDDRRLPDPLPAVARLPRGLAGVVLRHDNDPRRAVLGRALARICRARRLVLVVAGDTRLAASLGAGVHLRSARWPGAARVHRGWLTTSAHTPADLRRARRVGADLAFLSPVFPTASHPGTRTLGAARWTRLALRGRMNVAALGGISHGTIRRLPPICAVIGAIGALT